MNFYGFLVERSSNMKKLAIFIFIFIHPSYLLAQDILSLNKNLTKRQQDSIYFNNILNDKSIYQQYYVSINIIAPDYTGRIVLGAVAYKALVRKVLKVSSMDRPYTFALQLLLNDDTLRTDIPTSMFYQIPCYKVKTIPIVEEYIAKGEEAFLFYFFESPYHDDMAFIKRREVLLKQYSNIEWIEFQSSIIQQLCQWRYYCRPLHSAEGRLHCHKVFIPPPPSR